jgi:hypothetical protein
MFEEEGETFGEMKRGGGKFPQWAIWTIAAVAVVVIIGITVGVTLALSGGGETNKAPVITSFTAVPPVVSAGGYSTITCVASDPEGKPVSYTWTATGGTVSGIGSIVSWIAPNVAGAFSVGVTVSDGEGEVTNSSIAVSVSGATPTPTPTRTATATPTPTATPGPTSTTVTYGAISINSTPAGFIYIDDVNTGSITFYVATHIAAGNHSVKLVFSDDTWLEDDITVYGGETTYINWVAPTVQEDVVVQPDASAGKDAYVNESAPGTNYGTDTSLFVAGTAGNSTRMYTQFNLSSIPSTAIILSADLGLYYYGSEAGAVEGGPVGVYRVTGTWVESTITWNASLAAQSTPIDFIPVPASATSDFQLWDVSSLVQIWVNTPSTNRGALLRDTDETSGDGVKYFYSSDWSTDSQRPKLVITYFDSHP